MIAAFLLLMAFVPRIGATISLEKWVPNKPVEKLVLDPEIKKDEKIAMCAKVYREHSWVYYNETTGCSTTLAEWDDNDGKGNATSYSPGWATKDNYQLIYQRVTRGKNKTEDKILAPPPCGKYYLTSRKHVLALFNVFKPWDTTSTKLTFSPIGNCVWSVNCVGEPGRAHALIACPDNGNCQLRDEIGVGGEQGGVIVSVNRRDVTCISTGSGFGVSVVTETLPACSELSCKNAAVRCILAAVVVGALVLALVLCWAVAVLILLRDVEGKQKKRRVEPGQYALAELVIETQID